MRFTGSFCLVGLVPPPLVLWCCRRAAARCRRGFCRGSSLPPGDSPVARKRAVSLNPGDAALTGMIGMASDALQAHRDVED